MHENNYIKIEHYTVFLDKITISCKKKGWHLTSKQSYSIANLVSNKIKTTPKHFSFYENLVVLKVFKRNFLALNFLPEQPFLNFLRSMAVTGWSIR